MQKDCQRCGLPYEARTSSVRCPSCRKPGKVEAERAHRHASPDYRRRLAESRTKWLAKNPGKRREYWRRWYQKNRAVSAKRALEWHYNHREEARAKRERQKLRQYGLTPTDYNGMLTEQGNACAICGGQNGERKLAVDHNAVTGQVRGLLCTRCNNALGGFLHDSDLLGRAIKYLQSYGLLQ